MSPSSLLQNGGKKFSQPPSQDFQRIQNFERINFEKLNKTNESFSVEGAHLNKRVTLKVHDLSSIKNMESNDNFILPGSQTYFSHTKEPEIDHPGSATFKGLKGKIQSSRTELFFSNPKPKNENLEQILSNEEEVSRHLKVFRFDQKSSSEDSLQHVES